MFRNLQIYRVPGGLPISSDALAEQLATVSFQPCGAMDRHSGGWVPPRDDTGLVFAQDRQYILCAQFEAKVLPASYVNRIAGERAAKIESEQGYKPGRKQMRELRLQVEEELLPKAITKITRVPVWFDNRSGWLAIDGSPARADEVIGLLKRALTDSPPMRMPETAQSPAVAMTAWLAGAEAPGLLSIDRDCELKAASAERATVRYSHSNLDTEEVRGHIAAGKFVTRLALTLNDRVSFVLTDDFSIKRVALLDVVLEQASNDATCEADLYAANIALFTGELSRLIAAIIEACGGEVKKDESAAIQHHDERKAA